MLGTAVFGLFCNLVMMKTLHGGPGHSHGGGKGGHGGHGDKKEAGHGGHGDKPDSGHSHGGKGEHGDHVEGGHGGHGHGEGAENHNSKK